MSTTAREDRERTREVQNAATNFSSTRKRVKEEEKFPASLIRRDFKPINLITSLYYEVINYRLPIEKIYDSAAPINKPLFYLTRGKRGAARRHGTQRLLVLPLVVLQIFFPRIRLCSFAVSQRLSPTSARHGFQQDFLLAFSVARCAGKSAQAWGFLKSAEIARIFEKND